MTGNELAVLLARIQVLDNRQVDELTLQAWEPLMEGLAYADAVAAVNAHFRESTEYLKPAHIVQRVRASRLAALPATMSAARPECAPGAHRRFPDGTCLFCTHREWPDG
ncbi:hypothetical protein A9Z40_03000 [Microbacterium arborescens]|uniref:Uncharacterized protein n=1 Tax=Microbacterium arborescens TaxID=33883 RepID=A0ABX2WIR9_9MICO|nr:hypothetical protein [Microbacterium arborescens]OAZ40924.1 hypothetical protein A9Z40_03000 [Microbacterium arborescens]